MSENKPFISVVTPVYRASACVEELHRRLVAVMDRIGADFEIVMVNDASPDDSWTKIVALAEKDRRVKGINLSRNFGQHYALAAGIDHAEGDWVVVMDCDLQHLPEDIERLYAKAKEGHDAVFLRRVTRQDDFLKKLYSKAFMGAFRYLGNVRVDSAIGNFSIISRQIVRNLRGLREHNRSYPLFVHRLGFDIAYIDGENAKRFSGESSYTFARSLALAVDAIVSHSNRPLLISIGFGFLMTALSALYAADLILRYMLNGTPVTGWTSIMVSVFFVGGVLSANIGLLGLYLGKVFNETKNRPLYVVKQRLNCDDE